MAEPKDIIIAVDCDGVIFKHTRFPFVGEDNPGAIKWLKRFQELGARLFLWTCRNDSSLQNAIERIEDHGLLLEGYNDIDYGPGEFSPHPKLFANIYIDDAAFGAPLVYPKGERAYLDWDIVGPLVEKRILEGRIKL